ncbi:MAG: protein kinase [Bryobacteraceae bacterium]
MNPRRDAATLFHRALAMPAAERSAFLAGECTGDEPLRIEVEELLAASAQADADPRWNSAIELEAASMAAGATSDFGRYRLRGRLGAGGMGVVYEAVRSDDQFQKRVAVKLVPGGDPALAERLRRERQILANLEHPAIARLLDGGATSDGTPFLVMEYVAGVPIDRYVAERKPSQRALLDLFCQICGAVSYAHRNLVVHRDLKPSNILVTGEGEPKLLDFGIAKVLDGSAERTRTGAAALTPEYASPEQIRGEAVTTASDIYSLGVLLYELLSGRRMYRAGMSALELAGAITETDAPRLEDVDEDLDNIVHMALRKEPDRRYGSADQFAGEIHRYLEGYPVLARPATRFYRARKFVARNKSPLAAALLVFLALAGGIVATGREAAIANRRFNDVRQLAHTVIFEYADAIEPLPGSTPVRQKLVKDALAFLDQLSLEGGDAALRRELVEAYVKISNVQGNGWYKNLGDSAGARASADRAVAAGESLLRQDASADSLGAVASAYSARGDLTLAEGALDQADRAYRKSLELQQRVEQLRPGDLENSAHLIETLLGLADLYAGQGLQNLGQPEQAIRFQEQAAATARGLATRFPTERRAAKLLFRCLSAKAAVLAMTGHHREALEGAQNSLSVIQEISRKYPGNVTDRHAVAISYHRVASMLANEGEYAHALDNSVKGIEIEESLAKADPRNAAFTRNLAVQRNGLELILRRLGRPREALAESRKALAGLESLAARDPKNAEYRIEAAISRRKVAEALQDLRDVAAARDGCRQALRVFEEAPGDALSRFQLVKTLEVSAAIHEKTGDSAEALAELDRAAEQIGAMAAREPNNVNPRTEMARVLAQRGECLKRMNRVPEAREAYRKSLDTWAALGARGAISGGDSGEPDRIRKSLESVAR